MELDELLIQLVGRAQEVMATQGRLRGLLRATHLVSGDLALPAVLRRIVEAARELVGARYAALGVIAPTGGLAQFVHSGMDAATVTLVGHLPEGKGLLGALIEDPHPIRLRHIHDDARSSGFPAGHPPMESFLGVPIRIRDEVFGNLYLAESVRGEFSAEDEELTAALAATAAVAIENARLYASARRRGEWLQASATITRELLSSPDEGGQPLQSVADRTRDIADADLVLLLLPVDESPDADLAVAVAAGAGGETLRGARAGLAGTLPGHVAREGQAVLVEAIDERGPLLSAAPGPMDAGPVLAVPLLGTDRVHGVLCAVRWSGRTAFAETDLAMAASFASHAAVAIELADARAEQQRAAMLDDRQRIAADLHDHVIQRLFAAGLTLQTVAGSMRGGPMADRLTTTIGNLDETIRQIRTTIFQLQQEPQSADPGVRGRLLAVATEVAQVLGFEPGIRFSGVLEDVLPEPLVADVVAVLREALTNVGKHARARSAEVDVIARDGRLALVVADDGVGIGRPERSSGLANLRRRAEERGGEFAVEPRQPSGTVLTWSVPVG
jgi:signal transduction histidine kinase